LFLCAFYETLAGKGFGLGFGSLALTRVQVLATDPRMIPAAATGLDPAPTDALRRRPVRLSSFPEGFEIDADAEREATALASLLVAPLRELAQTSHVGGAPLRV
jgi:hypothetical protein